MKQITPPGPFTGLPAAWLEPLAKIGCARLKPKASPVNGAQESFFLRITSLILHICYRMGAPVGWVESLRPTKERHEQRWVSKTRPTLQEKEKSASPTRQQGHLVATNPEFQQTFEKIRHHVWVCPTFLSAVYPRPWAIRPRLIAVGPIFIASLGKASKNSLVELVIGRPRREQKPCMQRTA